MTGRQRKDTGFTMIEMLVVIAIIAILMALLVPVLAFARRKSRETATLANIKNIRMALDDYYTEWYRYPLDPTHTGQIADLGAGVDPGYYNTHCAGVGAPPDGSEDNSKLTNILVITKHLVANVTNLNSVGSFMDYFNTPIICRFMTIQSVDSSGNIISDKLAQRTYLWSYGYDRKQWVQATQDYVNLGLPSYDGQSPWGASPGSGEVGNMEKPQAVQDHDLCSWR